MATFATHKNQNDYKYQITLSRKRIRESKYAIETERDRNKAIRSLARELNATVINVTVPAPHYAN